MWWVIYHWKYFSDFYGKYMYMNIYIVPITEQTYFLELNRVELHINLTSMLQTHHMKLLVASHNPVVPITPIICRSTPLYGRNQDNSQTRQLTDMVFETILQQILRQLSCLVGELSCSRMDKLRYRQDSHADRLSSVTLIKEK